MICMHVCIISDTRSRMNIGCATHQLENPSPAAPISNVMSHTSTTWYTKRSINPSCF